MNNCKCNELPEIKGADVESYLHEHLIEKRVNNEDWTILYECKFTGTQWMLSYPYSYAHGGGPPLLSKLS